MASSIYITVFVLALSANLSPARSEVRLLPENGFHCTMEGLNSNPEDCNEFIICARNAEGEFYGATYKCSADEAFDAKSLKCVPADQAPECRRRFSREVTIGKPKVTSTTNVPTTTESTFNCHNRPMLCKDCHTLAICYENGDTFEFLAEFVCSENNQTTYCDDTLSACTSKVPPSCSSTFLCTGIGYFPDPSDCTRYQICHPEDDKILAATQYCATNQVYSTSSKMCVPKKRLSDCHKVTCPAGNVVNLAFPGDASYYVICINGKPDFVFYCGENKEFNAAKNTCEVVCKEAGRMPDSEDCKKYYECTPNRIGGTFTLTSHTCPTGTIYDNTNQLCMVGSTCT